MVDWYSAHLLAVAISILLLSVVDAFLTLILLQGGADEVNPVMAAMLYKGAAAFTAIKMALTGCSVLLLVCLSRYRFMRLVRVNAVMYMVLAAYTTLIAYEVWMLYHPLTPALVISPDRRHIPYCAAFG